MATPARRSTLVEGNHSSMSPGRPRRRIWCPVTTMPAANRLHRYSCKLPRWPLLPVPPAVFGGPHGASPHVLGVAISLALASTESATNLPLGAENSWSVPAQSA